MSAIRRIRYTRPPLPLDPLCCLEIGPSVARRMREKNVLDPQHAIVWGFISKELQKKLKTGLVTRNPRLGWAESGSRRAQSSPKFPLIVLDSLSKWNRVCRNYY